MSELASVKVRMYRGIFGDCFLIQATVNNNDQRETRSIVIDCGVLQNVMSGAETIKKLSDEVVKSVGKERLESIVAGPTQISAVAKDLIATVKNRIDLLVISHEHHDHLCGFAIEKDAFLGKNLTIGELWLAWTEDPKDPQANALRERLGKGKQALSAAVTLSSTLGADTPTRLQKVSALAAFSGLDPDSARTPGRLGTEAIIEMMKNKVGVANTRYLEPGLVIDLEAFGIKAYVLGPPRNETLLKKELPSRQGREVYLTQLDAAAAAESSVTAQLKLHSQGAGTSSAEGVTPFAPPHRRPFAAKQSGPSAHISEQSVYDLYMNPSDSWRRIDDEWTGAVEALALKLDSDTNNTSLALAFELPDGQVLLFPGDAQVGNWLSWSNQMYPSQPGKEVNSVTADELLRRVTFYKVGHHGSHNATLKQLGLEKMIDPRLTVAIPVVEAIAAVQGKGRSSVGAGWRMPYPKLHDELSARTRGRIIRGDGDPEEEKAAFKSNPTDVSRPVRLAYGPDYLWAELSIPIG